MNPQEEVNKSHLVHRFPDAALPVGKVADRDMMMTRERVDQLERAFIRQTGSLDNQPILTDFTANYMINQTPMRDIIPAFFKNKLNQCVNINSLTYEFAVFYFLKLKETTELISKHQLDSSAHELKYRSHGVEPPSIDNIQTSFNDYLLEFIFTNLFSTHLYAKEIAEYNAKEVAEYEMFSNKLNQYLFDLCLTHVLKAYLDFNFDQTLFDYAWLFAYLESPVCSLAKNEQVILQNSITVCAEEEENFMWVGCHNKSIHQFQRDLSSFTLHYMFTKAQVICTTIK